MNVTVKMMTSWLFETNWIKFFIEKAVFHFDNWSQEFQSEFASFFFFFPLAGDEGSESGARYKKKLATSRQTARLYTWKF